MMAFDVDRDTKASAKTAHANTRHPFASSSKAISKRRSYNTYEEMHSPPLLKHADAASNMFWSSDVASVGQLVTVQQCLQLAEFPAPTMPSAS